MGGRQKGGGGDTPSRMTRTRLFRKGSYLAIKADVEEGFWLCRTKRDVFLEDETFPACWLEKVGSTDDEYEKREDKDWIHLKSVIKKVVMFPLKKEKGRKWICRLVQPEKLKIANIVQKLEEGFCLNAYQKDNKFVNTADVLIMETDALENGTQKGKVENEGTRATKKRKSSCTTEKNAKIPTNKNKHEPKEKKRKINKKVTVPKVKTKVDTTNPNRKLKPNLNVKVWEKDPLFESKEEVPFVSSLAHSKLIIRAVLLNDMKLLNEHISNTKEIHSLHAKRSLGNDMTALKYALKTQNMPATTALLKSENKKNGKKIVRADLPACRLSTKETGKYNYRSLGIKNIRRLNMSRGSREGNNAFTKDQNTAVTEEYPKMAEMIMQWGLPAKFVTDLILVSEIAAAHMIGDIYTAVRFGNREIASHFIDKDIKQGSQSFSQYHVEALLSDDDPWLDKQIREVSARKKADYSNKGITPLHCACINPNTKPLEALFKVCPDLYLADQEERKLVHYAVACKSIGPLEFLHSKGANLEDPDRNGQTPLMIACKVGREKSADFIINKLGDNCDAFTLKKFGKAGIDKPAKDSWCPLHIAVAEGNTEVCKILLKHGAQPDKPLNTRYDKITPMMLAAANGDLQMVKLLIENKAKIEKFDRYKRTALTHAIINGSANVASYLLSVGADPNRLDSSQNSNLHYACAYGWWFCMQVLIEAGAKKNAENEWKLTPLGISILKGNKGITSHLMTMPDIDINVRDDKGRSILMNMLVNQEKYSQELLADIKNLVEKYGADPLIKDNDGMNILHFIVDNKVKCDNLRDKAKRNEMSKMLKMVSKVAKYFCEKNVSTLDTNNDGFLPLGIAFKNIQNSPTKYFGNKTGNVDMMKQLIITMEEEMSKSKEIMSNSTLYKVMQEFVKNIQILFSDEYLEVFNQLETFIKTKFSNTRFLDEVQDQNSHLTIFAELCNTYQNSKFMSGSWDYPGEEISDNTKEKCWDSFVSLLERFVQTYSPSLELEVTVKNKNKHFYPLLAFSKFKEDGFKAFEMILRYTKVVDVMDKDEETPLLSMIDQQNLKNIEMLLEAGSSANRVKCVKKTCQNKSKVTEKTLKELPIERALNTGNQNIVSCLLERGAKGQTLQMTNKSLIHSAVKECAKNKTKNNLALVKILLDFGCDVNEKDDENRTPLHAAINSGTDNPDESLDLEVLLMRQGANVNSLDNRMRTPLHYAFVKIGKHTNSSTMDPIQIVSSLVDAMDVPKIDQKDQFGSSPLHYAALRGATVCSLLLLQKGADIDGVDLKGNSPLSNAVLGKHDSCALMLIQKGANINVTIAKMDEKKNVDCEDRRRIKDLWKHMPEHWDEPSTDKPHMSLLQGIVMNDWLGITYIFLGKMDQFGMTFNEALEVALHINKLQFAKNLLNKQVDLSKISELVRHGRNLINCLAFETQSSKEQRYADLLEDVFTLLYVGGVKPNIPDNFGCLPLHYACLKKNRKLVELLLTKPEVIAEINKRDNLGRTPFAAFFWNGPGCSAEDEEETIPDLMLKYGADPGILFDSKPLDFLLQGYQNRFKNAEYNKPQIIGGNVSVSPYMIAIIFKDLKMMNCLRKSSLQACTSEDSEGKTPAMYAVKTNDSKIIQNVLKGCATFGENQRVDKNGHDLGHHIIAVEPNDEKSPTFDNDKVFKEFLASNKKSSSYVTLATRVGAHKILKSLNVDKPNQKVPHNTFNSTGKPLDHKIDSKKMVTILEEQAEKKKKLDLDETKKTQHGCTVTDGSIHENYDILMNKVDVGFGAWGLYNFYRIQIWKETHKDLYILFTNWGRIETYGHGQYQNTPYSTAEEAIKEFHKIFKAKTGNDWADLEHFENKPKRYRLVRAEHANKVVRPAVKFDLQTVVKPKLPYDTLAMLKDITDLKMLSSSYKSDVDIDSGAVPFGRIKREAVLEAKELLLKLKPMVEEREKLDQKKFKAEGKAQEVILQKLNDVLDNILKLSSEYYYLVPKKGFEYEKVPPIDREDKVREETNRLNLILEFESAESILLGSMLQRKEVNPLDYIYSCINCQVELMSEDSKESQWIMQYMYRSRDAKKQRVEGIFRVGRDNEMGRVSSGKTQQKRLLWHGTNLSNLISILNNGMVINPLHAQRTGRAFGDGVYFADMFDKSYGYTGGSNYMLLCEVDLGICKKGSSGHLNESEQKAKKDSLWVIGKNIPDEKLTFKTNNGYEIPMGPIIKHHDDNVHHWHRVNYSEYISFDESKIVVRYIVKMGNKSKSYTEEDFLFKVHASDDDDDDDDNNGDDEDVEEEEEEEEDEEEEDEEY